MKSILLVLCLVAGTVCSAQTTADDRLLAKFSQEQIADFQLNHPDILAYWTYYVDNSYFLVDSYSSGKSLDAPLTISVSDMEDFNILNYPLTMDRNNRLNVKIEGSNMVLVLLSNNEFSTNFNDYRSQK